MQVDEFPFPAFQLQHCGGWGSDVLLLAIKRVGLLEPGRNPGRLSVLLAGIRLDISFYLNCALTKKHGIDREEKDRWNT